MPRARDRVAFVAFFDRLCNTGRLIADPWHDHGRTEPANTHQPDPLLGTGGSFFNLIDVAQGYTFDPALVSAVSRKTHGSAGTFDIDLLPPASGIECRSGGANGDHQVVVTFASAVTVGGASISSGTGSVGSFTVNGSQVTVNLTGVANAQTITISLDNVSDGTNMGCAAIPMSLLLADANANGSINSADVAQTKSRVGQTVDASNFRSDVNANGGSDYFETGVTNPDLILADLVKIFHPDLLPDHELYFYRQLGK